MKTIVEIHAFPDLCSSQEERYFMSNGSKSIFRKNASAAQPLAKIMGTDTRKVFRDYINQCLSIISWIKAIFTCKNKFFQAIIVYFWVIFAHFYEHYALKYHLYAMKCNYIEILFIKLVLDIYNIDLQINLISFKVIY
eukprot:365485_1